MATKDTVQNDRPIHPHCDIPKERQKLKQQADKCLQNHFRSLQAISQATKLLWNVDTQLQGLVAKQVDVIAVQAGQIEEKDEKIEEYHINAVLQDDELGVFKDALSQAIRLADQKDEEIKILKRKLEVMEEKHEKRYHKLRKVHEWTKEEDED